MDGFRSTALRTILINTLIAVFLTAVGVGQLVDNFIVSQCIGLSVFAAFYTSVQATRPGRARALAVSASVLIGVLLGTSLGLLLVGIESGHTLSDNAARTLLIGLVFGGAVASLFYLRGRKASLEAELQAAELRRVEAEKREIEARLAALQAQIEPHFLFNTLANLSALIRTDSTAAEAMLADLIRYLRATLARSRGPGATLGDEVDLLQAYLEILKRRMGTRLSYSFEVPQALRAHAFPPMLLQPLVENAVKHGLEPKIEGGEVRVSATADEERLRLSVVDSGVGLGAGTGDGVGLDNVRERLKALYGASARLEVEENQRGGVTARLELPA